MGRCLKFLALLGLGLAGPWPATAETFSNDQLLRNFDIVAFGNEYTGRRYESVRKWAGPIRFGIQGGKYPTYLERYVVQVIGDLKRLTGHPMELYYSFRKQKTKQLPRDFDPKKVNVILFYLPDEQIPKAVAKYWDGSEAKVREMVRVSTCFAKFMTKGSTIKAAVVVFPARHPQEYIRACVVEELTQILGLPNDSNGVRPSIFNDGSKYMELTHHDRWMLRLLYDKSITPGMPRREAINIGRLFLERHRKPGAGQ